MEIRVQRTSNFACLPQKMKQLSAGYDLFTPEMFVLQAGRRLTINLKIKVEIPEGYYGELGDRSGLASKDGIHVLAGKIDNDYRGEWRVVLLNTSNHSKLFQHGDRIAQVIFQKYGDFPVVEVDQVNETERGEDGFGSTGA